MRIVNDGICERPEIEHFLSNLRLVSGMPVIIVDPPTARVEIDDSSDCRTFGVCLCAFMPSLFSLQVECLLMIL